MSKHLIFASLFVIVTFAGIHPVLAQPSSPYRVTPYFPAQAPSYGSDAADTGVPYQAAPYQPVPYQPAPYQPAAQDLPKPPPEPTGGYVSHAAGDGTDAYPRDTYRTDTYAIERRFLNGSDHVSDYLLALVLIGIVLLALFFWQVASIRQGIQGAEAAAGAAQAIGAAARDQAKLASSAYLAAAEAIQRAQRPWIVAERIVLNKPIHYENGRFYLSTDLILRNTGPSVARDVRTWIRIERNYGPTLERNWARVSDDLRDWKKLDEKFAWPLGLVLAPGQSVSQPFGFGGPVADGPAVEHIQRGGFYLLGYTEYVDQFGVTHFTRFAFNPPWDEAHVWDEATLVISGGFQEAS